MKQLMKKLTKVFSLLIGIALLGSLVSCNSHEHTFSDEWMFDAQNHWHPATCEHKDEKSGLEKHEFSEWTTKTKETCTEAEVLHRTCKCGYEETKTGKPAKGHSFSEDYLYDNTHHWHAAICEHTDLISGKEPHSYGDWVITKEATCTTVGSKEKVCKCGHKVIETIPLLAHDMSSDWLYDNDGHWHKCKNCDAISEKEAHSYGDWVITKEPTCTTTGTKVKTCTVCGQKHSETIPVLKHDLEETWSNNYTYHWHNCKECHEQIGKEPHTFEFTKDSSLLIPFFDDENYLYYAKKCSVCGFHIPIPDVADFEFVCDNIDYIEEVRKEEYNIKFIDANGKDLYGSAPLIVKEHDAVHFTSDTPTLGTFVGWKIVTGKGSGNIITGLCPDLGDTDDAFTLQAVYSDYASLKIEDGYQITGKGFVVAGVMQSGKIKVNDLLYHYNPATNTLSPTSYKVMGIEEGITHNTFNEISYLSTGHYGLLLEGLSERLKTGYLVPGIANEITNLSAIKDKEYDGSAAEFSINTLNGPATCLYKTSGSSGYLLNPPKNPGIYFAVINKDAGNGYYAIKETVQFEILKKKITNLTIKSSESVKQDLESIPGSNNLTPNHDAYEYTLKTKDGLVGSDEVKVMVLVPKTLAAGAEITLNVKPAGGAFEANKGYFQVSGTDKAKYNLTGAKFIK